MALMECKHCGKMISEKALVCPGCKHEQTINNKREDEVCEPNELHNKRQNKYCLVGFILGLISIFLGGSLGLLPIITIIISVLGLIQFKNGSYNNKWMGIVGTILGTVYFIVYLYNYGYIN